MTKKFYYILISIAITSLIFLFVNMSWAKDTNLVSPNLKLEFFGTNHKDREVYPTVIILPGGGYAGHAMDHEGYDWIGYFNDNGLNVALLQYTLPEGNAQLPLQDVSAAMKLLKENSAEWHVDTSNIGVMGFSAGGHLASTFATHSKEEEKPAFQILFYPVISLEENLTHAGSRNNFLGEDQSAERVKFYSNEFQVDKTTPPAIIFHSGDDGLVVPMNSINYYNALRAAGVSAALHIYPVGEHGWGFRESFPYHEAMLKDLETWLLNLNNQH